MVNYLAQVQAVDGTWSPVNTESNTKETRRIRMAVIAVLGFMVWTVMVCCITGVIVRKNTTARVTSELRAGFQRYLTEMEEEQRASQFLTGEESLEAAVNELADTFDELIATYSMDFGTTADGCRTLGWTFIARVIKSSDEFGKTPEEIVSRPQAWEGKVVGHAVRNQDTELAKEIARAYLKGQYPDKFTPDMVFGARESAGGFVARNEYITGPNTVYWRYGK